MLYQSQQMTKGSLLSVMSSNMSLLKMTLLCASLFLCTFTSTITAAPTSEVMEDETAAAAMAHGSISGNERLQNELAMIFSPNDNVDQINNLFGDRLRTLFLSFPATDKMSKRDDDIPPGFIGVRGRRGSRSPRDFSEILRSLLNNGNPNGALVVTPEMHNYIKGQMKKSDSNNVYKDGFLGVRG